MEFILSFGGIIMKRFLYHSKIIINFYVITYAVIFAFLVHHCVQATDTTNETTNKKTTSSVLKSPSTLTAGAFTAGGAIAALTAYFKAKNRVITTLPTDLDLTLFGNPQGQPIIYSHGFGGNLSDIYYYTKQNNPFQPHHLFNPTQYHIATFNYPDSTKIRHEVKYDHVALAQENDINRLNQAVNEFDHETMIGFGISRGASTFINMMGTIKNPKIKALILEAPFASISDVLSHFIHQTPFSSCIPFFETVAHKLATTIFPQYQTNGLQPIDTIDQIDSEIPMLLIHSIQDEVTPINSSRQLYIKRKQQGCNNVYLLELPSGQHVYCLWRKEDSSGEIFQNVVHRFLKQYDFPYNKEFADKVNLEAYQPPIKEVFEKIANST